MKATRLLALVALLVGGFFLPDALGGSTLVFNTVVVIAIFSVMAYGVDIILSDLGEVSLAHTVFFATGAYAVGVLGVTYGLSSWATLVGAVVFSVAIGGFLGLITLNVQGFVFSLVTYAAAIVSLNIAHNLAFLGASDGIVGIPMLDLSIGPFELRAANNRAIWPFAYILLLATVFFVHRFRRSTIGRAAHMVHLNERLATMTGIAPRRVRLQVLVLSAVVTAVAGWLYSYQRAYVGPDLFETYFLILMLTAAVLPGKRVLVGPLVGTAILMVQKAFFSYGGYFDKIVLGGILVVVLALYPRGLVGLWDAAVGRIRRASAPTSSTSV